MGISTKDSEDKLNERLESLERRLEEFQTAVEIMDNTIGEAGEDIKKALEEGFEMVIEYMNVDKD